MMWAPRMVTPDLCVATFVYLDSGLLLSLRASSQRSRICLLLGLTLGLGYFAKAILFPMAFVFIASRIFYDRRMAKSRAPSRCDYPCLLCDVRTAIHCHVQKGRPTQLQ